MRLLEDNSRNVMLAKPAEISQTAADTIHGAQRLREDLGMDSLQSLELLSSIGEVLRIDLDIERAMAIRTVDDACDFVERQFGEQGPDGRMCG